MSPCKNSKYLYFISSLLLCWSIWLDEYNIFFPKNSCGFITFLYIFVLSLISILFYSFFLGIILFCQFLRWILRKFLFKYCSSCISHILTGYVFIFIQLKYFLISSVTFTFIFGFFRSVLFANQLFWDFPSIFLLLISV